MRHLKWLPGAALLITSLNVVAELEPKPTPRLGDVVEYTGATAVLDCSRWTVSDLDADGYMLMTCGELTSYWSIENDYNLVRIIDGAGEPLLEFSPFLPAMEFPFEMGDAWKGSYKGYVSVPGVTWHTKTYCEVVGWEDLEVGAGTFGAYRIDCVDKTSGAGASVDYNTTRWYAPDIQMIIRVVNEQDPQWNLELTHFERATE